MRQSGHKQLQQTSDRKRKEVFCFCTTVSLSLPPFVFLSLPLSFILPLSFSSILSLSLSPFHSPFLFHFSLSLFLPEHKTHMSCCTDAFPSITWTKVGRRDTWVSTGRRENPRRTYTNEKFWGTEEQERQRGEGGEENCTENKILVTQPSASERLKPN